MNITWKAKMAAGKGQLVGTVEFDIDDKICVAEVSSLQQADWIVGKADVRWLKYEAADVDATSTSVVRWHDGAAAAAVIFSFYGDKIQTVTVTLDI